jgi:hypothetical protein
VQRLIWGYKFLHEIARRMPHFASEPSDLHPAFAPGRPASIVAHADEPVEFDMPHIVYSEDDERALEEFSHAKGARQLPFSVSLAIILMPFYCAGSAVTTCYHSVSSSLLYAVRDVVNDAHTFPYAIVH